jgi:hypothetical protein
MTLMFFVGSEASRPGLFARIWQDSVWSKVIGGVITALLFWVWAEARKLWKRDVAQKLTPYVADVVPNAGTSFPLKIYVEMRNNTKRCMDVRLVEYKPKNISLERFSPRTLQLFFLNWQPKDESVERIAVYPGQRFRAWFGADPKKHTEQQVRENIGKLGTLIVSVNGKDIPIDL